MPVDIYSFSFGINLNIELEGEAKCERCVAVLQLRLQLGQLVAGPNEIKAIAVKLGLTLQADIIKAVLPEIAFLHWTRSIDMYIS